MSYYSDIQDAKKHLEQMQYGLQYVKDAAQKEKQINRLNAFIKLINMSEALLAASPDKDTIDVCLLLWFKAEYDKVQHDGREGFVSAEQLNLLRKEIGSHIASGRDALITEIAMSMAIDTLANATEVDESAKLDNVTKNNQMLEYIDECQQHWSSQLNNFINYCHSRFIVWS